jgi:hypothetical protein
MYITLEDLAQEDRLRYRAKNADRLNRRHKDQVRRDRNQIKNQSAKGIF